MAEQLTPHFTTVPHGFHYHYEEPKTPERELSPELPTKLPSPRGFRVRRRVRPRLNTTSISSKTSDMMEDLYETPIPSIEVSDREENTPSQPELPKQSRRLLTPLHQLSKTIPQTPADRQFQRACTPSRPIINLESIERPSSPFSSFSDSSEGSCIDSEDGFSYGGSVTSPESDSADPFSFDSPTKGFTASQDRLSNIIPSSPTPQKFVPKKCWTKDMDNHIWGVYMSYLNDPTVTPFKTLPGCPPPVGVCHRVAREATKTWKGGRVLSGTSRLEQLRRESSPDTVTQESGSKTPTGSTFTRNSPWPGAGSATRKRFRELCKRKATIIPHYQRMLRSASPYLGDAPIKSTRTGSPFTSKDSFATRDVVMSLATATSSTMRPDGPLAQMANDSNQEWFNQQHQGPWASPAPIPSDVERNESIGASITRLGSPFSGAHTWGPSRSKRDERPRATSLHPTSTNTIPRLRSPVHFGTVGAPKPPNMFSTIFTSTRTPKRPAQTALEDELSNLDAQARKNRHDDVFGNSLQNASRRLRLRGMSLGAHLAQDTVAASEPATMVGAVVNANARSSIFSSCPPVGIYASGIEDPFAPVSSSESAPRLGSPFPGISSRPTRSRRGRHVTSLSLPSAAAIDLDSAGPLIVEGSSLDNQ